MKLEAAKNELRRRAILLEIGGFRPPGNADASWFGRVNPEPRLPAQEGSRTVCTEENKLLVRRFYEEVVNTGDVERLEGLISPDYVEVHNNTRHPAGIAGAKEHVLGSRRTYPDLHLTVEQQIAEGEWVVTRVTARGTHQGVWLGMKPT